MTRVTFLHPDLGIGGAERLVVDAALALKKRGHKVNIITTHHDRRHSFHEIINGEIPVTVVGDWIPRSIFNRFYALMAYLRMIYAAFYIILFGTCPDVVFCDLVSVAIPFLKIKINNVIYYCHYPDQLLTDRKGFWKNMYRAPLDWLEEVSMAKASHIFVNSKFTAGVFKNTFRNLQIDPDILYPSLNMNLFDSFDDYFMPSALENVIKEDTICFLSINRYERKKNLKLALEALAELKTIVSDSDWNKVHLVMAGGYDIRVTENVEHFKELTDIRSVLQLNDKVTFLKSPTDAVKLTLFEICTCLIYTPSNEHFGIVPIEAMYRNKPVIAVNNGGPTETIVSGETGFLCEAFPNEFANAMSKFILNCNLSKELGAAGKKRVISLFSFENFANKLDQTIIQLMTKNINFTDSN